MTTAGQLRLALRVEGTWWVAYAAQLDTMDGAEEIARIRMPIVAGPDRSARKHTFVALMQDAMTCLITELTGRVPTWNEPGPAPESERAGQA